MQAESTTLFSHARHAKKSDITAYQKNCPQARNSVNCSFQSELHLSTPEVSYIAQSCRSKLMFTPVKFTETWHFQSIHAQQHPTLGGPETGAKSFRLARDLRIVNPLVSPTMSWIRISAVIVGWSSSRSSLSYQRKHLHLLGLQLQSQHIISALFAVIGVLV